METGPDQNTPMYERPDLVFLLDVDNTLLDNDALKVEISSRIEATVGKQPAERFWTIYEEVRQEEEYVDYPETLSRFVAECGASARGDRVQEILDTLSFARFLYPGVMETLQYLWTLGTVTILSDGDQVFQRQKIRKSGLEDAVKGNVMIYIHKEDHLSEIFARYPAKHYVIVDDKARILSLLEATGPETFTTVFVLQGHYSREVGFQPPPDVVIQHISDLRSFSKEQFLHPTRRVRSPLNS